jgi:hypothetical protein
MGHVMRKKRESRIIDILSETFSEHVVHERPDGHTGWSR